MYNSTHNMCTMNKSLYMNIIQKKIAALRRHSRRKVHMQAGFFGGSHAQRDEHTWNALITKLGRARELQRKSQRRSLQSAIRMAVRCQAAWLSRGDSNNVNNFFDDTIFILVLIFLVRLCVLCSFLCFLCAYNLHKILSRCIAVSR